MTSQQGPDEVNVRSFPWSRWWTLKQTVAAPFFFFPDMISKSKHKRQKNSRTFSLEHLHFFFILLPFATEHLQGDNEPKLQSTLEE